MIAEPGQPVTVVSAVGAADENGRQPNEEAWEVYVRPGVVCDRVCAARSVPCQGVW